MGAIRTPVSITGGSAGDAGTAVRVEGDDAVRTLHFDPETMYVSKDTSTVPPRVEIGVRIDPEAPTLGELDTRVDALETEVAGHDQAIVDLQSLGGPTEVAWAASIAVNWSNYPSRHIRLTATDSTNLTFAAFTNATDGFDYTITLDNYGGYGPSYSFPDANGWDVESPPWTVIFGGPIPQFSGDPEVFTFTFRYLRGKMRLTNVCFANDA